MSWTCPDCKRVHAVPPKWCGCTPYPAIGFEPDGWWVVSGDGGDRTAVADHLALETIERFALTEAGDETGTPHLLRRWVHDGVETIAEEGEQRFPLTTAALDFLLRRP